MGVNQGCRNLARYAWHTPGKGIKILRTFLPIKFFFGLGIPDEGPHFEVSVIVVPEGVF